VKYCPHEYGKWSAAFNNAVNQFNLCRQSKICALCGKIVVRRIWWSGCCVSQAVNAALDAAKEGGDGQSK
jgi:hypothetical protein